MAFKELMVNYAQTSSGQYCGNSPMQLIRQMIILKFRNPINAQRHALPIIAVNDSEHYIQHQYPVTGYYIINNDECSCLVTVFICIIQLVGAACLVQKDMFVLKSYM